jgi:hypothetical protein
MKMSFSETVQNGSVKLTTEFAQPLICGEKGSFNIWLKNITDKPLENIVLREKTFKLSSTPFDLAPGEKCKITFVVEVPENFEYSPPVEFEVLKVLPPFSWDKYENAAQPEFPDRKYEAAKTTIPSLFRIWKPAERHFTLNLKIAKLTIENKIIRGLADLGFPEPKKTAETGGGLVFNLSGKDYAVIQAYIAPSKTTEKREIIFWLVPCIVEQPIKNKRVARVKFLDEPVERYVWPFTKDRASDFQIIMDFLTQKYAEKRLLMVIFDGKGGYNFENWMLIP